MTRPPTLEKNNRPAFLFLGTTLLMLVFAVVLARFALEEINRIGGDPRIQWRKDRFDEMLQAIPLIASSREPAVLAIGGSEIEFGFEPVRFDQAAAHLGVRIQSYNLGIRDLQHQFPFIVGKIKTEFEKKNRKPRLILILLAPALLTYRAEQSSKFQYNGREFEALLLDQQAPNLDLARIDPNAYLNALATYFFFHGRSSNNTFHNLQYYLLHDYFQYHDDSDSTRGVVSKFFNDPRFFVKPTWNLSTGGFPDQGYLKDEARWRNDFSPEERIALVWDSLKHQDRTVDLSGLHIDPKAVDEFVSLVELSEHTADHVALLRLPEHEALHRNPAAHSRLDQLMEALRLRTSAVVLDYSKRRLLNDDDYFDVLHVNRSGRRKLMEALASDLAPLLRSDARTGRVKRSASEGSRR